MPGRPGALILASLLAVTAVPSGAADFLGAFEWNRSDRNHGGFSAIEMGPDGRDFVALTDRSGLVEGTITRADDQIVRVDAGPIINLRNRRGKPMRGPFGDSEGLAIGPSGTFISFERTPRVWRYPSPDAIPEGLPRADVFYRMKANAALEALAIDDAGALYTMRESAPWGTFGIWVFADGVWSKGFEIRVRDGYEITGADFDDHGRLYLLERKFRAVGFMTGLRRFTLGPEGVTREEVLLDTPLRTHDNLEGIGIWRNDAGHLIATMVSDDNFHWYQTTELVEYRLPD